VVVATFTGPTPGNPLFSIPQNKSADPSPLKSTAIGETSIGTGPGFDAITCTGARSQLGPAQVVQICHGEVPVVAAGH